MNKSNEYYKMKYFKYKAKYEGIKVNLNGGMPYFGFSKETSTELKQKAEELEQKSAELKQKAKELSKKEINDAIKLKNRKKNFMQQIINHNGDVEKLKKMEYNDIIEYIKNELKLTELERNALLKEAVICQKKKTKIHTKNKNNNWFFNTLNDVKDVLSDTIYPTYILDDDCKQNESKLN
jgi:hypothetical protein